MTTSTATILAAVLGGAFLMFISLMTVAVQLGRVLQAIKDQDRRITRLETVADGAGGTIQLRT